MISIVICSRQKQIAESLRTNIDQTIGVAYEVVWIDNSQNNYTIFSAYNKGVQLARFDYICFMHEDIVFHSTDWGKQVVQSLSAQKVGAIGVIGGCYVGKMSLSWYSHPECCRGEILQGVVRGKTYSTYRESFGNAGCVCSVDGLWMCMRKELFDQNLVAWDETLYSGFHLYDFDMCMQLHQRGLNVEVLSGISIEHRSLGTKNTVFYDEVLKFHKKWDAFLPLIAHGFELPVGFDEQNHMLQEYCQLAKANYRRVEKLSHWLYKIVGKLLW